MKTLKGTIVTLIILVGLAACSSPQDQPIDDGGLVSDEEGQIIDEGGLTAEEGQPIDDGGLVVPVVANTAWELLAIRDYDALLAADENSPAIIEFKEDGTFHMTTGCGELAGTYTLDGETISFEVQMTTMVENCSELQVQQALAVENLLMNATSYSVEEETLTIAIDGNNDARFERLQKIDDGGLIVPVVANTAWELLAIRDYDALLAADLDSPAVLELKEDGTFHMTTGCGELAGTYTLDGEAISFEVQMITAVENCSELQVQQALAVENLLMNATSHSVEEETLTIAIDGNNDARFERLQKIDDGGLVVLEDITWQWSNLVETEPAAQSVVPSPESYTLTFLPDGVVSIQADCNVVSGSYTLEGSQLSIEHGPSTLAFCGEESLDVQYLDLLTQVESYVLDNGQLVLGLENGAGSMAFDASGS